jgi:histidinol dehydrogenase
VGIYIPAGTAPLFSTLLMLGVPAKVAGCREIVLSTPGGREATLNPAIAFCAQLLGIDEIYLVGGAQAVAALAYGTESIKPVSKICGPGNRYVTEAKLQVGAQGVAIDMPAGPSEVLVIADEGANPRCVAADLLAQAEHGPDSQVVLVACSHALVECVLEQVTLQTAQLPRQEVVREALEKSFALVVESIDEALEFANLYAPEHLILSVEEPERLVEKVTNAGSVFLGYWAAEALGDYASGTNHVLPTNAAARAYSGVSVDTFVKKVTFQSVSRGGLLELSDAVVTLARAEGLEAHAQAVVVRREAKVDGGQ